MKKDLFLIAVIMLLFAGCKKDSNENNLNSTWTINGKSYSALKTSYLVDVEALIAADNEDLNNTKNEIDLSFLKKPNTSGSFKVVDWQRYGTGPFDGEIFIEIIVDGKSFYETAGQTGDFASVSILSGGKIKVTFNNVTFIDENNNKVKSSGTIIEQ